MSNQFAYFLYEYERDSDALKRVIEIVDCNEDYIRYKYSQNSDSFPYIYDAYQIDSVEEILNLSLNLDISQIDFSRYDYMLEANTIDSDGEVILKLPIS